MKTGNADLQIGDLVIIESHFSHSNYPQLLLIVEIHEQLNRVYFQNDDYYRIDLLMKDERDNTIQIQRVPR